MKHWMIIAGVSLVSLATIIAVSVQQEQERLYMRRGVLREIELMKIQSKQQEAINKDIR